MDPSPPQASRAPKTIDRLRTRERTLWKQGAKYVAGIDEAGIGPLAGPVVAAAVVLPAGLNVDSLDDSKKLTPTQREIQYDFICEHAAAWCVTEIECAQIDEINIYHAGLLAMRRSIEGLKVRVQHALVDGREVPELYCPQTRIVGGDACEATIAAASILAKVVRDRIMVEYDTDHPGYGFAQHKGYPTQKHREALRLLGPSPIHRMSFPAVAEFAGRFGDLFETFAARARAIRSDDELRDWRESLRGVKDRLTDPEKKRLRAIAVRAVTAR